MPRFIYISKTDEENSDYNATFEALREKYGNKIAPVVVPIWNEGKKVTGIIDVLNKRAYEMQNGFSAWKPARLPGCRRRRR